MYNKTKHKEKKHFCMKCLQCSSSEETVTNHREKMRKKQTKRPEIVNNIKFTGYHKQRKSHFAIYVDFEANLKYVEKNNKNKPIQSYTNKNQEHIAFSYGYKVVHIGYRFNKPEQIYQDEDAIHKFISEMFEEVKCCHK